MKKLLTIAAVLALFGTLFVSCASKNKESKTEEASAPVVTIPTEPVVLEFGVDYWLEPVFGQDYVSLDGQTIYFGQGAANNNHAILLSLMDTTKFYKDFAIQIEYEMGSYDASRSCQLCVQPSSFDTADYGNQNYPILYNNYEPENPKVLTVEINKLLKSSVKKQLAGVRLVCNNGSYDKYTWQDNWDFTITKVTLVPSEVLGHAK